VLSAETPDFGGWRRPHIPGTSSNGTPETKELGPIWL
jgi:hypothetical protein